MRETSESETALLHAWVQSSAASAHCMHIHIFNKVARSVKTMNAKNTKKSPIHENANITCDFGDGDINSSRSQLLHTRTDGQPHR